MGWEGSDGMGGMAWEGWHGRDIMGGMGWEGWDGCEGRDRKAGMA